MKFVVYQVLDDFDEIPIARFKSYELAMDFINYELATSDLNFKLSVYKRGII